VYRDSEHTVLRPEATENFILTPTLERVVKRAHAYLKGGYAIHFSGAAGSGKTTLAFYLASLLNRPVVVVYGDEEYSTADLLGGEQGFHRSKTVDNFIHTVLKVDENMSKDWVDHRLALACKNGYTLLYDEFNRSRPEANNVLLSVLEEKLLCMPSHYTGCNAYQTVHPEFRAIFTSNPMEYAGIHDTQDALLDRMITVGLGCPDMDTEVKIAKAKSGLPIEDVETIVKIVRKLREKGRNHSRPTIRASIMIAKMLVQEGIPVAPGKDFLEICSDILGTSSNGDARGLTLDDVMPYFSRENSKEKSEHNER